MKAVMETIPNEEVLINLDHEIFLHSNEGQSINNNGKVKKYKQTVRSGLPWWQGQVGPPLGRG